MSDIICYICDNNFSYKLYEGTEHLDGDGNKPCFQCLLEAGYFDEEDEDE